MPAGSRRPAFSPYSMLVDELRLSSHCCGRDEVSQPILPGPQAVENVGILSLLLLKSSKLLSSRAQSRKGYSNLMSWRPSAKMKQCLLSQGTASLPSFRGSDALALSRVPPMLFVTDVHGLATTPTFCYQKGPLVSFVSSRLDEIRSLRTP
jgi:hypothetical protein